jgi:hypothetical protein
VRARVEQVVALGPYTRNEIESRCLSGSSINVPLLVGALLGSLLVLLGIVAAFIFWKRRSAEHDQRLFNDSSIRFSANENFASERDRGRNRQRDEDQLTIRSSQFLRDTNILTERL